MRIRDLEVKVKALNLEKEELVKDKIDILEKLRLQVSFTTKYSSHSSSSFPYSTLGGVGTCNRPGEHT